MDRSLFRALKQTITVTMITQTATSRILMTTAAATADDEPPTVLMCICTVKNMSSQDFVHVIVLGCI